MKSKKLAIAAASAMLMAGMGSAHAQSDEAGLMSALSATLGNVFSTGVAIPAVTAVAGTPDTYATWVSSSSSNPKYVLDSDGTYRLATAAELALVVPPAFYQRTAGTPGVAAVAARVSNAVDITALAGAVNVSKINGGIDISGTNVSITGISGDVAAKAEAIGSTTSSATSFAINGNNFSTTVIGAMNSSTLDLAKKTEAISDMTKSTLNIAGLANQGAAPSINTQDFGAGQLGLSTLGSSILAGATASTQFDMNGLVSGTETLATKTTDSLQGMNVFNMAVNMAPIEAGVKIAAAVDTNAWFLNPQTGVVNLSNLQLATTAIGAMNSSVTHLGANLTTLLK